MELQHNIKRDQTRSVETSTLPTQVRICVEFIEYNPQMGQSFKSSDRKGHLNRNKQSKKFEIIEELPCSKEVVKTEKIVLEIPRECTALNFISKDRVDINKLLLYVKTLDKGHSHRICKTLRVYITNWRRTFETHSNVDFMRLIRFMDKLNIDVSELKCYLSVRTNMTLKFTPQSSEGWEPQMMGLVNPFTLIGNVNTLTEQITGELPKVSKTFDSVADVSNKLGDILKKFENMCSDSSITQKIVSLINKIYLFVACVWHKSSWDLIASSFFNMVDGLVPPTVIKTIFNSLELCLRRASQGVLNGEPVFEAQEGSENDGFVSCIFSAITQSFFGLFGCLEKEQFTGFQTKVKKISALALLLKSCSTIFEYIVTALDFILKFVVKFITKKMGFLPKYFIPAKLQELYDELEFIEENNIVESSLICDAGARRIIRFRESVNEIFKSGCDKEIGKLVLVHLNFIKREAEKWYAAIPPYLKNLPGSDRVRPVWIYFFGAPRIGKTSVIAKSVVYACARKDKMHLTESCEKWDSFVHGRNLGAEYWDGYANQPVVSYTDILQTLKDEKTMDLAAIELTRINDSNAYGLNMAFDGVKGKGKNFFTSKLIVSDAQGNMNISPLTDRCWSKGVHLFARRTIVCEVVLNSKYAKAATSVNGVIADEGINQEAFATAYSEGNFIFTESMPVAPRDAYTFRFYHNTRHTVIREIQDFDTAIEFMATTATNEYHKENRQSEFVDEYCQKLFIEPQTGESFNWDKPVDQWCDRQKEVYLMQLHMDCTTCVCKNRLYSDTMCDLYCISSRCFVDEDHFEKFLFDLNCNKVKKNKMVSKMGIFLIDFAKTLAKYTKYVADWLADKYKSFKQWILTFPIFEYLQKFSGLLGVATTLLRCYTGYKIGQYVGGKIDDYRVLNNDKRIAHHVDPTFEKMITNDILTDKEKSQLTDFETYLCFMASKDTYWNRYEKLSGIKRLDFLKFIEDVKMWRSDHPCTDVYDGSGDLVLTDHNFKSTIERVVAQSAEHRERVSKLPVRTRVRSLLPQMSQPDTESVLSLRNSMARILVYKNNGSKQIIVCHVSMLNTGGDEFIIPRHYWNRAKEYVSCGAGLKVYWPSKENNKFSDIYVGSVQEMDRTLMWDHAADLSYIKIKNFCCGKDIAKKFISIKDNPNLTETFLVGIRSLHHHCEESCDILYDGKNFKIESIPVSGCRLFTNTQDFSTDVFNNEGLSYVAESVNHDNLGLKASAIEVNLVQFYKYNRCKTCSGDCGVLLAHKDPKVVAKNIGMHVAAAPRFGYGIACPIYQEDILDARAYFGSVVLVEDTEYTVAKLPETGFAAQAADLDLFCEGSLGEFDKNGKLVSWRVNIPNRTKIRKSLVYDAMDIDFGPAKTAPAKLNKETIDGVEISPMLKALEKMSAYTSMIEEEYTKPIVSHISDSIESWRTPWTECERRILTLNEALNGIPGLKQLDIKTSAGFPFVKLAKTTNKVPWLNIVERADYSKILSPKDELASMVYKRLDYAKQGKILPTFFVDTLKDETRSLEKVSSFKSRLFQVGPLDLTILTRMYFGIFMAHMQNSSLEGECGVGINPDSIEWTHLIRRLLLNGFEFLCGDYSFYDGSLSCQMAYLCAEIINNFYNDSEENKQVRLVILLTMFNSYHIVDLFVYLSKQGNPSGNALTTIINVLCNMIFHRFVYMKTVSQCLYQYNKQVVSTFYGDDNFSSISKTIKPMFNMLSMRDTLMKIGVVYTSADKKELVEPLVSLTKSSYLKRGFVLEKFDIYGAPLDYDTIIEIARWAQGDPMNVSDQMGRFNTALMHMSAHGIKEFEMLRSHFVKYCIELRNGCYELEGKQLYLDFDPSLLFTYTRCKSLMYPDYYKTMIDLANVLSSKHEVLLSLQDGLN
jgi:uncharacterized protein YoxC